MIRDFKKRNDPKKVIYSAPVIFVLLIAVIFAGRTVWKGYQKYNHGLTAFSLEESKIDELMKRRAFLETALNRYQTAAGVESVIREKFGLGKEGERLIVIVENEIGEPGISELDEGFWQKFKSLFK